MRTYAILVICLMGLASASAASTAVQAGQTKDLIDDALALFDWALGLLEQFGISIMDVLAQFLPAELVDILQILVDLGIIPIAKQSIVDQLLEAIQLIIDEGLAAFEQLIDLIPQPILNILQALWELGIFPSKTVARQGVDDWLLALIDVLIQLLGDAALDLLVQIAGDLGIPADLIQILWDFIVNPTSALEVSPSHSVRQDIILWAIQMLTELGLQALEFLAEFLPPELLSLLVELVLGEGVTIPSK